MRINLDVRPHEVIDDIWLGDDGPYEFAPAKVGSLLSAVLMSSREGGTEEAQMNAIRARKDWLEKGFHPDDWAQILDRVQDENEVLDWGHLIGSDNSLIEQLLEQVSGRPTTSSGGSSATPRRNTGVAAPRPKARTSGTTPPEDSAT